jgi:putative spermidine/putrescine transport system substrate-binding protein
VATFLSRSMQVVAAAMALLTLAACGGAAPASAPPSSSAAAKPASSPAANPAASAAAKPASSAQAPAQAGGEIVFATWSSHADFLKDAFAKFEKDTGVKVRLELDDAGQRTTKLYAEKGAPSIDVALVTPGDATKLAKDGVTDPPDPNLPNMKNLYPSAHSDIDYVTNYLTIGLFYNPTKTSAPTSWLDLWDPKYKGKVGLSTWPESPAVVELMMAARLHGGSDDNLDPGFQALKQLLPVKFYSQTPNLEPLVAQGDAIIGAENYGVIKQLKDKGIPIEWATPKEGAAFDTNYMVITKGSKNKAAAEKFADFFLGPDVQLAYMRARAYGTVNKAVTIPADLEGQVHPTADEEKSLIPIPWDKFSARDQEISEQWTKQLLGK